MAKEIQKAGRIETALKSAEFYDCKALGLRISTEFLKVDDRVVAMADKLGIDLDWDDVGRIRNISLVDARRLLDALGSHLLTPAEYWLAYQEAQAAGRTDVLESLASDEAAEWLDVVYYKSEDGKIVMVEHPDFCFEEDGVRVNGEIKEISQPEGRPGWFDREVHGIDPPTGLPLSVTTTRAKGTPQWSARYWKWWSTDKKNDPRAAIRGYVVSSGTPSLDCDIPIEAKMKHLMIRECRRTLPEPELNQALVDEVLPLVNIYLDTICDTPGLNNVNEHQRLYETRQQILEFLNRFGDQVILGRDHAIRIIREKIIDILGILRLEAIQRRDESTQVRLNTISKKYFEKAGGQVSFENLLAFSQSSTHRLERAIANHQPIVFVMGHRNPDTDTVISSLFEAYRNSLINPNICYVPLVQADRMPDEIARLLGAALTGAFMLWNHPLYQKAENLGQTRWVLTDHNKSAKQRFAVSIVDHHIMSKVADGQNISKTWDMVGSCASQIAQKFIGMGITFDPGPARLFHGATLMDTENRGPKKMTYRDRLIMDYLQGLSGITDESEFYQDLMSHLLNTNDPERLLARDYKEDWGIFGFAVAKVKGMFGPNGEDLKPEVLAGLVTAAEANNHAKNLCMTIIKVVDYEDDNEKVNCERIYLVFNQYAPPEFRKVMFETLAHIIRHQFGSEVKIRTTRDAIEFKGTGDQLSRKVTAPQFEGVVAAFNRFYHSEILGKEVARDFLTLTPEVKKAANELNIELFADKHGRICNITYVEMKKLAKAMGYTMLSLGEYWKLLAETKQTHDTQMQEHLKSEGFVEFTDTIVQKHSEMIDHPEVIETPDGVVYQGEARQVSVIPAHPGLIRPGDIDQETGLPLRVSFDQSDYADPETLRYWSPDAQVVNPTRSFIFLSDKAALDMKNHPDDALPNMGARMVTDKVRYPTVTYEVVDGKLNIIITE